MVIVCPECSTKFRVNAERIPDKGAKVRCARCKHVFLAQKELPEELPIPLVEEVPADEEPATPVTTHTEPETAATEVPFVEPPSDLAAETPGFSYEQFRELDANKSDDDEFTFGTPEEAIEEPAAPVDEFAAESEDEESFSFSGPADETEDVVAEQPATEESVEQLKTQADEPSSEEKAASIFSDDDSAEEAEPAVQPTKPQTTVEKTGPATSIIRILLLLILGLAIIGGALYYVNGPEQIQDVIQQIFGQQTDPADNGRISLADLEGKFVNNQDAGELFVIRGEVTNNYKEPRAAIQVKGVIFDPNGKPLLQKTIFCGNPISDQELQTLPFSKLEEMMRNQFGKSMDNMTVNNKETISFVIAFRDLPKSLSEFSVDVTSSEPATK